MSTDAPPETPPDESAGVTLDRVQGVEPLRAFSYAVGEAERRGETDTFIVPDGDSITVPADVAYQAIACGRCWGQPINHKPGGPICDRCGLIDSVHAKDSADAAICADGKPPAFSDKTAEYVCPDGGAAIFYFKESPSSKMKMKTNFQTETT